MTSNSETSTRLAAAMEAAGDVVYEWDLETDAVVWGGNVRELFSSLSAAAVASGDAFHARISPEDLPVRLKALADHYETREALDCEYRFRQIDGAFCWVHDRGRAEFSPSGHPIKVRGVLRLINRRKEYEAQLEHLANFDELTGHYNRNRLREALQQAVVHSQRYGETGAYLTVGIDKLAMINDAFGYASADAVIVAVGERMERFVRASDIVGRVGGDVYGVILQRCSEAEMASAAEKILRLFREQPVQTPTGPIHVSVSIGGVGFPEYVKTASEVMAKAETALQGAKRQGRDCFVRYELSAAQQLEHRRNLAIGEQVKAAIRNNRVIFAFQPVVDARTGEVEFYESLLRLQGPDGAIIPASTFIPVVERLGLTRLVDKRVLELVVAELIAYPEVSLALNISGFTATDRSWLRSLVALLKDRPQVARRLIVEITETAAIQDIEETARFVSTVRDLGCRVALDDFGAGYTSFRHLKSLTVDIVKIDGSFVRNLSSSPDNQLFIRSLLGLANGFGLRTVAECVETAEDAEMLEREGVRLLQGYYFGRPEIERPWLAVPADVVAGAGAGAGFLDGAPAAKARALVGARQS